MTAAAARTNGVVLVVEDFDDTRELYVGCLTDAGFTALAARDGVEAFALATSALHPVDAIVMDLQMPAMDGWEAIRRIRATAGPSPYILVVSAYDGPVSLREAYDAGADDFLGKPLDPTVLVTIVRAALRSRRKAITTPAP